MSWKVPNSPAPGLILQDVLNDLYLEYAKIPHPALTIVETGTMREMQPIAEFSDGWSTLYIADWVATHPGTFFHSVDLNADAIDTAHRKLEEHGLAKYCTFHCQDSLKFLSGLTWVDFALLDSCDGLQHGVDEFRLAASAGASVIVMDDFQTKAAWAVKQSQEAGWRYEQAGRYSVLRRG